MARLPGRPPLPGVRGGSLRFAWAPLLLLPLLLTLGVARADVGDATATWCVGDFCIEPVIPGKGGPGVRGMIVTVLFVRDGILGTTVSLTADVDCLLCVFRWDMGDGTIRSGRSVTHTYAVYGLWAEFLVELETCVQTEKVCETRYISLFFFHWPAIIAIAGGFIILLWLLRRRIRFQVERV